MSLEEYVTAADEWYNGLGAEERTEYEYARMAAEAYSPEQEYFFMKGWVARNV